MTNYIIEGDIDFYKELNINKTNLFKENVCLISNETLNDTSITLPCNHSFNYIPLYKEVCRQKYKFNSLEVKKLRSYEMKCPYCRNVIDNILPYVPNLPDVDKVKYVNIPSKYSYYPNKCSYIWKSGKRKDTQCGKPCLKEYCSCHSKYVNTIVNKNTCKAILKTGKNKGKNCCLNVFESGFCKKHYNLIQK